MQYTPPGITLSDVVEQYLIASFNDKRTFYLNFLFNAQIAWRELFWTTLFRVKEVSLPVCRDKNGLYIKKPKDLVRLLSVKAKDKRGCYHSLLLSGDVPTEFLATPDSRHCDTCGSDNLSNILETKVTTRQEKADNGITYCLKTFFNTLPDGTVQEVEEYLVFDSSIEDDAKKVRIAMRDKAVCSVKVRSCGCIEDSEANRKELAQYCGCGEHIMPNCYGYFNHKFEDGRISLELSEKDGEELPTQLLVSYQTDTEDGMEEAIVPIYAVNTVIAGIGYYSSLFRSSSTMSDRDKEGLRKNYNRAKEQLLLFMFPFDLDAFAGLQDIMPKW